MINHTRHTALSTAAASYNAALQACSHAKIARETFVDTFGKLFPWARTSDTFASMLAGLLDELATTGSITLPKDKRHWDPGHPPIPKWLKLASRPRADTPKPIVAWRPELSWAAEAHVTQTQTEYLTAINRWYRDIDDHCRQEPLPMRERSHQIFADEKRLDALLSTSLFAPGRLTLEKLHAFREPVPLAYSRVGDGATLLVAENSDTYASLRHILSTTTSNIGYVAFGAGRAFESSIATATELGPLDRIIYFGDIDADGLAIPNRASITALELRLPPVEPAAALYTMLLSREPTAGTVIETHRAEQLVQWLPAPLQTTTSQNLQAGKRWAQEAVNRNNLRDDPTWIKSTTSTLCA